MKRKLHLMMAVAIVAVAGLAIYANQPKEEMSDVMLANIEALATGESIGQCRWKRVFDSNGCQYWVCIINGDGNTCTCGSTQG